MMVYPHSTLELLVRSYLHGCNWNIIGVPGYLATDSIPPCGKRSSSTINAYIRFALCVCIVLLASCTLPPDNPGAIASELVDAFVAADIKRAKAVTVPEQWDRVEEWMEGRQVFECRGGEWDTTGTGGPGYYDTTNNEWIYSLGYQCSSQSTPYCLDVNDIQIRKTEDGWKVYDWGTICEAYDYGYRCEEMCW